MKSPGSPKPPGFFENLRNAPADLMREIKGIVSPKPKESPQNQADQVARRAKEVELAAANARAATLPKQIEDARNRAMMLAERPLMRPPVPLKPVEGFRPAPPKVESRPVRNPEKDPRQLREEIRQIDQQIAQVAVAVDQNRRDGFSHQADWNEDFLKSLQQRRNRTKSQLDQHAP